jgi:hypothetical protein
MTGGTVARPRGLPSLNPSSHCTQKVFICFRSKP